MTYHVNYGLPAESLVYVIGEARLLYVKQPVVHFAPWDRSLLGEFVRSDPDRPERWAHELSRRAITHVWVSYPELERLRAAEFADPLLPSELVARFLHDFGRPVARSPGGSILYELVSPPS